MIAAKSVLRVAATAIAKPSAMTPLMTTRAMSSGLTERMTDIVPAKREELKSLMSSHGGDKIGEVTVEQLIGGARGVLCMLWDTSLLDAEEGIRFRNLTIPELQAALPTRKEGGEPTPEALMWLLMTGEIPSQAQNDALTAELHARSELPAGVEDLVNSYPKEMHPMTQFSSAVLAMQSDSEFVRAYQGGVHKNELWKPALEDSLNLIARLPRVAAMIYRNVFHDGVVGAYDATNDYSGNYASMMGFDDEAFAELMRIYLVIHADHEGGNVSAHATHLVGSALSDPYLAFSAGMNGLAGPLHGLANQEVLSWVLQVQAEFERRGVEVNHDTIRDFAWETLNAGRVIPGYGHAVLRKTDPRYSAQRKFALTHMPDDPLFKIVGTIYEVVPDVLIEHGKTKNPWPNVDAHSGVLLTHYGFTEHNYCTVLFGVSRALGVLSQYVWDRALGLPLERPKSITMEALRAKVA